MPELLPRMAMPVVSYIQLARRGGVPTPVPSGREGRKGRRRPDATHSAPTGPSRRATGRLRLVPVRGQNGPREPQGRMEAADT